MPEPIQFDLRRALTQQLESLRLAGLTHVPRITRSATRQIETSASAVAEPVADAAPALSPVSPAPATATRPPVASPEASAQPDLIGRNPPVTKSQPALSKEDRIARLETLCSQVTGCTRCQELAETRTQTVFGVGDPEARILFVGEAPGADEDRQGEPFVGRAGQLLNKIIEACKLKREDVYICNILKCRPPGNRNPTPDEAANCREYLDGQIATVAPEYIVCWGSVAAQRLMETTSPIGRLRGKFYQHGDAKVLCTYHPSYLLRNPAAKKDVWEDMKFLFGDMGVDLDSK